MDYRYQGETDAFFRSIFMKNMIFIMAISAWNSVSDKNQSRGFWMKSMRQGFALLFVWRRMSWVNSG